MENHLLRLSAQEDYVCKVLEEIIIFDKEKNETVASLSIIEKAENDLE